MALLQRAVDAHLEDQKRFQHVAGTGRIEFIHADNEAYFSCTAEFRMSGQTIFLDLRKVESVPPERFKNDRVQVIAAGDRATKRIFSPELVPSGCETIIRHPRQDVLGVASEVTRINPRHLLEPVILRGSDPAARLVAASAAIKFGGDSTGGPETEMQTQNGFYARLWFDERHGGRLRRIELGRPEDKTPLQVMEYLWRESSSGVVPAEYVFQELGMITGDRHHTHRIIVDTFRSLDETADVRIDESLLKDCEGRTVGPQKLLQDNRP